MIRSFARLVGHVASFLIASAIGGLVALFGLAQAQQCDGGFFCKFAHSLIVEKNEASTVPTNCIGAPELKKIRALAIVTAGYKSVDQTLPAIEAAGQCMTMDEAISAVCSNLHGLWSGDAACQLIIKQP